MLLKVPESLAEYPVGRITNREIDIKIPANGIRLKILA